jgi:hypothetical protein
MREVYAEARPDLHDKESLRERLRDIAAIARVRADLLLAVAPGVHPADGVEAALAAHLSVEAEALAALLK